MYLSNLCWCRKMANDLRNILVHTYNSYVLCFWFSNSVWWINILFSINPKQCGGGSKCPIGQEIGPFLPGVLAFFDSHNFMILFDLILWIPCNFVILKKKKAKKIWLFCCVLLCFPTFFNAEVCNYTISMLLTRLLSGIS